MKKAGLFLSGVLSLALVGCGPQGAAPSTEVGYESGQTTRAPAPPNNVRIDNSPYDSRTMPARESIAATKAEFLNKLRNADPQYRTIEKAILNEENELGLVLGRDVDMEDIPKLMTAVLKQMAGQFPGEDLTVVAYAPSQPPMKIGTGRLDARTREMTYTPARQ